MFVRAVGSSGAIGAALARAMGSGVGCVV